MNEMVLNAFGVKCDVSVDVVVVTIPNGIRNDASGIRDER